MDISIEQALLNLGIREVNVIYGADDTGEAGPCWWATLDDGTFTEEDEAGYSSGDTIKDAIWASITDYQNEKNGEIEL